MLASATRFILRLSVQFDLFTLLIPLLLGFEYVFFSIQKMSDIVFAKVLPSVLVRLIPVMYVMASALIYSNSISTKATEAMHWPSCPAWSIKLEVLITVHLPRCRAGH